MVQALRDLDGPHICALERIRAAEDTYVLTDEDLADIAKYKPEDQADQRAMKYQDAPCQAVQGALALVCVRGQ